MTEGRAGEGKAGERSGGGAEGELGANPSVRPDATATARGGSVHARRVHARRVNAR